MKGATVWFHEAQSCRVLTLGSGSVRLGNNIVILRCLKVAGKERKTRWSLFLHVPSVF